MNDAVVEKISQCGGCDKRFALDLYYHFLQLFGTLILQIPSESFETIIYNEMHASMISNKNQLPIESLTVIIKQFKALGNYPEDPHEQLRLAINMIYKNWYSKK